MGQAENPVMYAVEQVCGLYGVQFTREQSRVFKVESGGRWRPMYFGQWTDQNGARRFGKADFLTRPRIRLDGISPLRISVPLWIECKSLEGKTNRKTKLDQAAFEQWVRKNGDFYMRVQEDIRPLVAWFDEHGVEKQCDDAALASVVTPIDASLINELSCKWCAFRRDQHLGRILSCPLHLAACNTKLIGKVYSPDLRKGVTNAKTISARYPGAGSERS